MSAVQGKVWGTTQCVFHSDSVEVHHACVAAGGYCSEHIHTTKFNRFVVLSGELEVLIFQGDIADVTVLRAGMCTDVPPGVYHMFRARQDTQLVEIYWAALNPADIVRRSTGGRHASDPIMVSDP